MSLVNAIETALGAQSIESRERPVFGVVTAVVTAIEDDGTYRVSYLSFGGDEASSPARVMMPMAGARRGTYFFPEIGDEVVVAFERGNRNLPVILGGVWNDDAPPPRQANPSKKNHVRTIVSRSGHEITLDDTPGKQRVTIRSQAGHTVELDDGRGGAIRVTTARGLTLVLDDAARSVRIDGGARLSIDADAIEMNASTITLTTTATALTSRVIIDGKPFGAHAHFPASTGTPPATGPVAP